MSAPSERLAAVPSDRYRRLSLRTIADILGFIGVAASLVFVGVQIRQNTAVARAQARQELASLNQEWLMLQSTDSVFGNIYRRAWSEPDARLSPSEEWRANFGMRLHMRRLENVYFQYKEGLVDESALLSYGFKGNRVYHSARFNDFWVTRDERSTYDPGFVRLFEHRFQLDGTAENGKVSVTKGQNSR